MAFEFTGNKKKFNEVQIRPKQDAGVTNPFEVFNAAGTSGFLITAAGAYTSAGLATLDAGATIKTGQVLTVTDVAGMSVGGTVQTATMDEINSIADASARIVTLTGDTTLTAATHANRTLLLGEVGGNALLTVTLPAATGTGLIYRFVVSVVNTSNYVIDGDANGADFVGNIWTNSTGDTPDLGQPWPAGAANDLITLNGTTTGGQAIGDWIEIQDILTDEYFVLGFTTTSGTEATPFSGS